MLPPLVHGVVAIGVAALQLAAPSRVVVLPTSVEGDAPTTVAEKFDDASQAGIADAGAETVASPDGCGNETCAAEAAGPRGYVLATTVEVKGSDYTIKTRLVDGAGKVVDEQSEPCEICTYEEAAEALQEMVAKSVGPIAEAAPPPPPPTDDASPPPPPPSGTTESDGGPNPKVLNSLGIAATAVGAGAIVGGIVLFVLNERPVKNNCEGPHIDADGDCEFRYNTLGGGAGLAIGGAVTLGVGVGLLLLKRSRGGGDSSAKVDVSASRGGLRLRF